MNVVNSRLSRVAGTGLLGFLCLALASQTMSQGEVTRIGPVRGDEASTSATEELIAVRDFPDQDEDWTFSLATFTVKVYDQAFVDALAGCWPYDAQNPRLGGWDAGAQEFHSPLMDDLGSGCPPHGSGTTIWRSDPHHDGDQADEDGTEVGEEGSGRYVKDDDFEFVPDRFRGPNGTPEVHTELVCLNMVRPGIGLALRAGWFFLDLAKSPGEVRSKNEGGDFPARSFFNVYVAVDLPPCGNSFEGGTVYNEDPLVVTNDDLHGFPPRVIYVHGETNAVRVVFGQDDPNYRGKTLGFITVAGHGVASADDPFTDDEFWEEWEKLNPASMPIPTVSHWGLVAMTLLLLAGGKVYYRRRRSLRGS